MTRREGLYSTVMDTTMMGGGSRLQGWQESEGGSDIPSYEEDSRGRYSRVTMVQNPTLADMGKTGLQLSNSNFEEKKHGIAKFCDNRTRWHHCILQNKIKPCPALHILSIIEQQIWARAASVILCNSFMLETSECH